MRLDTHIGMETEARNSGAARAGRHGEVLAFHGVADFHRAAAGTWSQGRAARDGRAVKLGEQRLALSQGVRLLRGGLRSQTAALKQALDTAANISGDPGDFFVAGRDHVLEYDIALFVDDVGSSVPGYPVPSTSATTPTRWNWHENGARMPRRRFRMPQSATSAAPQAALRRFRCRARSGRGGDSRCGCAGCCRNSRWARR